ncbi:22794_t:CDS:10 [Cetraspora pellucida]|uniref:22794_t:CDS:1 n=1 Tax=Cetraspora pellucida TaxID=1433469 RepID=A0A9N9HQK3_9GLOM|nr:22794_t:CDS:10 [Cetraspora pellucida]
MEFAKVIQTKSVQEWKEKYIDYKGLLRKLRDIQLSMQYNDNQSHRTASFLSRPAARRPSFTSQRSHSQKSLSQRAMSLTSMAESANVLLNKVSYKLSHWTKQPSIPEHTTKIPITSIETLLEQSSPEETAFFLSLDKELEKVTRFYTRKEGEVIYLFEKLKNYNESLKPSSELRREIKRNTSIGDFAPKFLRKSSSYAEFSDEKSHIPSSKYKNAKKKIKKAAFELYRGAELLKNYRQLNKRGFAELLKRYDKITGINGSEYYMQKVSESSFVKSRGLDRLMKEIETFYSNHFEESRKQAIKKLRSHNRTNTYHTAALRVGLCLGLSLSLLYYLVQNNDNPLHLRFYMGLFIPTVFALLMGAAMSLWEKTHINYKFIFELDPRNNLGVYQYLELPSFMFLLLSFMMYSDYSNLFGFDYDDIDIYLAVAFIVTAVTLFCPIRILHYNARRWFILTLGRIIAPFWFGIEFRDFFIADVLNSLSYTFIAIQLSFCHPWSGIHASCYGSSYFKEITTNILQPFISSIPQWLRILQCLKRLWDTREMIHLVNILKYLSVIISTFFFWIQLRNVGNNLTTICWVVVQTISSIYTFTWDVKMDWSLLQIHSSNYLLRDELGFKNQYIYKVSIVINLILRFSWILFLIFRTDIFHIGIIVAFLEVFRRLMWCIIRVEDEHVANCKGYRAIKEIHTLFVYPDDIIESSSDTVGVDEKLEAKKSKFDSIMKGWVNRTMSTRVSRKNKLRDFNPRFEMNEESYNSDEEYDDYDDYGDTSSAERRETVSALYASRRLPIFTDIEGGRESYTSA